MTSLLASSRNTRTGRARALRAVTARALGVLLILMLVPGCGSSGEWSCKGSEDVGRSSFATAQPSSTQQPAASRVSGVTYVDAGERSENLVYPAMEPYVSASTEASYWVDSGGRRIAELWLARITNSTPQTMSNLRYDIAYPDRVLGDADGRQPDTRTINGVEVFYVYGSAEGSSLNGMANPHDRYSWYQGDTLAGVWMADSAYRDDVCQFVVAYVEAST